MNFNPEQRKAIFGDEPLIVVAAGAGSGKTKVLTERYVYLCEQQLKSKLGLECNPEIGADVPSIVALTFTEDAALEMKDRIRKRLNEKLTSVGAEYQEHLEVAETFWINQLESLDQAIISTFHSFCQRIVSEHTYEIGIFPNIEVMDETQSNLVKAELFSELMEESDVAQKWQTIVNLIYPKELQKCLFSVYAKLKEFEIKTNIKETLHIETLLTEWETMKYSALENFQDEMEQFFMSNPDISKLTPATRKTYDNVRMIYGSNLIGDQLYDAISTTLSNEIKNKVPVKYEKQNVAFYNLLNSWLAARNVWEESPTGKQKEVLKMVVREFEDLILSFDEKYETKKRELALLDFSDLQQKAISLLNNQQAQSYYSNLFKHFLIDEYQDTNQLQMTMLEKIKPSYSFIVGDSKQSIYRFRGADVQLLNSLAKVAKREPNYSFVDMNINYRTCDSIIQFINLLFQQDHLMGSMLPDNAPLYKTEYSPLTAYRNQPIETQKRVEYIRITEEQDKSKNENQYIMIARRMIELIKDRREVYDKESNHWRPVEWRDIAVLIASRTNLTTLEKALNDVDIPFNVYGGLGFYERQEVVDFISLLNWINKPYEPLYMMAVLRSPVIGVTMDEFIEIQAVHGEEMSISTFIYEHHFVNLHDENLKGKLDSFYQLYKRWVPFHWSGAIRSVLYRLFEDSGLKKLLLLQKNNLSKVKNIEKVIETIVDLGSSSMDEMLTKLAIIADLSEKEGDAEVELSGGNFVHIMTVHGSKGLEFPVVFVPNLSKSMPPETRNIRYDHGGGLSIKLKIENEEDLLADPIEFKSPNFEMLASLVKEQAIEESKRLFYVALTRARDSLILTAHENGIKNTWSKWLDDSICSSVKLGNYLEIKTTIAEQTPVETESEIYDGPSVKITRSIPVSFSVSEVMSYVNDPEVFYEKHILKLDDKWLEEEELDVDDEDLKSTSYSNYVKATVLGTLVHRICELLDKGYAEDDAYKEAFTMFTDKGEAAVYYQKVMPLVEVYQQKSLGQPVANEWEFTLELNGVHIIGEIDKIVQNQNGGIEVIDLKTNMINDNIDELIQYYKPQFYLYKLAYEKITQNCVDNMAIIFLRDHKKSYYTIPYDPTYEKEVIKAIADMERIKTDNWMVG
ncbi:UvrD-helicase domain-containing protein [Bacillus sp. Marseille-P3661]|uniref:UvrD-helicase domain-containing protein n=1 Tax=Bacillus sp. Marseille-P3661 TaxID=1936234 RepID=UPI000C84C949|nr:UvrD-helicase domain-containing protein [Bacillus sp. Marseille-P3661]